MSVGKKIREKSTECHNHKPQPFPDTKISSASCINVLFVCIFINTLLQAISKRKVQVVLQSQTAALPRHQDKFCDLLQMYNLYVYLILFYLAYLLICDTEINKSILLNNFPL